MADVTQTPTSVPQGSGGATVDDINATLQNIARQLGLQASSLLNANPSATAATSPAAYGYNNIDTTGTTVLAANASRFGVIFHNPGDTATIYVYPTNIDTAPTTATLGGSFAILPGGTFSLPSTVFSNVNGAWAAFAGTGSSQPLTVVEFL